MGNERGVILNWLVKIILVLAIVGVVLYDVGAVVVNYVGLDSTADDIAIAISTEVGGGATDQTQLEADAKALAHEAGARLIAVIIDPQANTVSVKLKRTAKTLIVRRVEPLEDWGRATSTGRSGTD